MTNLYANLILSYVYRETNETAARRVRNLLQSDAEARNLYQYLCKSRQLLDKCLPVHYPCKSVVNNILHYAGCM
jgi:hypothetical protein